ncbi:MAG: type III secretion system export apparatus subunit SctT [Deltaproteobacteria bacterium]|nr:type III secretion system export apparatus subunit SctT [Deltaproteobacteria bacterium]MBI4223717.1 type III secretion system export apparatus subunit SctT [Deltaproteobacteria bacterium]
MEAYLQRLGLNLEFPFVLIVAGLIWVRALAMISVIPFLFGKATPRTTRLGTSVILTIFLYPILVTPELSVAGIDTLELFVLFFKEVLIGLTLGFAVSLPFYGFQAAGQMIDNQRGVSLARILIPELGEQVSISANFLFHFAVVVFLVIGGHRLFLKAFAESYLILPLLEFPPSVAGLLPVMDLFGTMTAKVLFLSVQLAAPVIIAILLVDIILGVANRFAPQINVWELGFNVRGYVGVLLLFLSIGLIGNQIVHYTGESDQEVRTMIRLFKEKPKEVPPEQPETPLEKPHPIVPSP